MVESKKVLRNANIRLSALNIAHQDNDALAIKAGDTIEYSKEKIIKILEDWSESKDIKYYFAEHNENPENLHFHIVITFPNNSICTFKTLKAKFPYGLIESCKHSVKTCVQYLIHFNHPYKYQYQWSDIITNAPDRLEFYKIPGKATLEMKTNIIIDKILKGEIKEFEIDKIAPEIYVGNKHKIKDAFEYYLKKLQQNSDRNVQVFVLQGNPGTGKTTFCKVYAQNNNKSICFSSASNDPWQDYSMEDIFVYDDFNFDSVKIEDILKGLDPNNSSTVSARYRNKLFIGDTIFICTNIPITEWYKDANENHRKALFRRITCVLDFTDVENYLSHYTVNDIIDSVDSQGNKRILLKQRENVSRQFDFINYIKVDKTKKLNDFTNYLNTLG